MKFISYVIEQTFLFALPNNDFRKTCALEKKKKTTTTFYVYLLVLFHVLECILIGPEHLKIKAVATTLVENMFLLNCMISFHSPPLKKCHAMW